MTHMVVGMGEVGKALATVLRTMEDRVDGWDDAGFNWDDPKLEYRSNTGRVDWVHICIPWKDKASFDGTAQYWKRFGKVIVHSTVPLGTCDALGVCHSPIRGVHPNLVDGIRMFVKYFGGVYSTEAAEMFKEIGIVSRDFKNARTTEAIKLWDTAQYGRLIMLEKEIYQWCIEHQIDPGIVYRMANRDYNEGYLALGRPEVVRPYLRHVDGPIGGHCVLPNAELLGVKL